MQNPQGDFHAGLEEHPNPAPLQRGNGTFRKSFTASTAQLVLGMLCFCGMPRASCSLWGKRSCRPRSRALLVPSPKLLLEKQNNTHGAAWLDAAQQDFLQIQSHERALHPRQDRCCCCFWDAPTSHSCLPREQNFCHVCSQHTGSGSCSLQLLLFQQNHRFYGANFIEDQMNPVFSSTSTDQPTALIPFCQKTGRNKRPSA